MGGLASIESSFRGKVEAITREPWLFVRDERIDWGDYWTMISRGSVSWAIDETLLRRRERADLVGTLVGAYRAGGLGELVDHIGRGAGFGAALFNAGRAANGVRLLTLEHNQYPGEMSVFGGDICRATNHPLLPHGHEHCRRVEYGARALIKNIPELRHGGDSIMTMLRPLMLTMYGHDRAQNVWEFYNWQQGNGEKLPVKLGHEWVAAVWEQMLHHRHAREHDLPNREAWVDAAFAAAIELVHAEPEKFAQRREATLVLPWDTPPNEVYEAWDKSELDVLALTPAQTLQVAYWLRHQNDAVKRNPQWWAHPAVEAEYPRELAELSHNHRQLVENVDDWEREAFWLGAEVLARADGQDMVTPYFQSILRTFMTQLSEGRPLFRADMTEATLLESVFDGPGNFPSDSDSDWRRKWWEFFHVTDIMPDSIIGQSKYVQKLTRDNVMLAALAFRRIAAEVLVGDLSSVQEIYEQREREMRQKGERRADIDQEKLEQKLFQLEQEKARLLEVLVMKKDPAAVGICVAVSDKMIRSLAENYHVSPFEMRGYEKVVRRWGIPRMQPYQSADSIGGGRPRVLREPTPLVLRVLSGEIKL